MEHSSPSAGMLNNPILPLLRFRGSFSLPHLCPLPQIRQDGRGAGRGYCLLLGWFARNRIPFTLTLTIRAFFMPRPWEASGIQGHSKANSRGHTPDFASGTLEWRPGMDSTMVDGAMFRNKGFEPSGPWAAVFMEEAGCHGNRQVTGTGAAFHPLSLRIPPHISFCGRPLLPSPRPPACHKLLWASRAPVSGA